MPSALERGLQIIELLAGVKGGLPLREIADTLQLPRSATHRLLTELVDSGFAHQRSALGNYALGLKLIGLGQRHLAANDIVGLARPVLDALAATSRELVRLAVLDGEEMLWIAKSQGAPMGLRYDPDSGSTVTLSCSATGTAWMSAIPEEEALTRILRQGIAPRDRFGPKAPQTIDEIRAILAKARKVGYAISIDTYTVGIGSVATAVYDRERVVGVLSVAGPTARLTEERLKELSVPLRQAASEVSKLFDQSAGLLLSPQPSKALPGRRKGLA